MARRGWGHSSYYSYGGFGGYAPYVSVAKRKANAAAHAKRLEKKTGRKLEPVKIEGRRIAKSFWGQAWCDNLEAYSDFANRLPRGKTYARNGSVIDLQITAGKITALVSGSEIYELSINIKTLDTKLWREIQRDCAQSISSLVDLLQGRFDRGVMDRLTRRNDGLFPKPKEISLKCSCPDSAGLCKHLAAVMYGVGARLDHSPELLFTLRNVDHLEMIGQAVTAENLDQAFGSKAAAELADSDLSQMFGIELESLDSATEKVHLQSPKKPRANSKRPTKKTPTSRQAATKKQKTALKSTKTGKKAGESAIRIEKNVAAVPAKSDPSTKKSKSQPTQSKTAIRSPKKLVPSVVGAPAAKPRRRTTK